MELHVSIAAETLFYIGPVAVTNSMLTMWIVMVLILGAFTAIAKSARAVPSKKQSLLEVILEFVMGLVEGTAGRAYGRKILPLITGIFIFILFANYSGLFPGVGTIGYYEEHAAVSEADHSAAPADGYGDAPADSHSEAEGTPEASLMVAAVASDSTGSPEVAPAAEGGKTLIPFLRAPNADLNMTLALALVTFMTVQILGIRAHGVGGRIKHMADPPFLFPIELISEFSRIISLSARLFGNVFAGEVLLAVMFSLAATIKIALIPVVIPVIFLFLEVMFSTIQALVFALLTTIYITLAAAGHGDHDHADDHGHAGGVARGGAAH
jgi:F-type H+-transporting ATPase subunit a